jgi:DNA repair exonuclease SbcCD ATPase subunit
MSEFSKEEIKTAAEWCFYHQKCNVCCLYVNEGDCTKIFAKAFLEQIEAPKTTDDNLKADNQRLTMENQTLAKQIEDAKKFTAKLIANAESDNQIHDTLSSTNSELREYIEHLEQKLSRDSVTYLKQIEEQQKEIRELSDSNYNLQKDVSATLRTIALQAAQGGNI